MFVQLPRAHQDCLNGLLMVQCSTLVSSGFVGLLSISSLVWILCLEQKSYPTLCHGWLSRQIETLLLKNNFKLFPEFFTETNALLIQITKEDESNTIQDFLWNTLKLQQMTVKSTPHALYQVQTLTKLPMVGEAHQT